MSERRARESATILRRRELVVPAGAVLGTCLEPVGELSKIPQTAARAQAALSDRSQFHLTDNKNSRVKRLLPKPALSTTLGIRLRRLALLVLNQRAVERLELLDPLQHLNPPVAVRLLLA